MIDAGTGSSLHIEAPAPVWDLALRKKGSLVDRRADARLSIPAQLRLSASTASSQARVVTAISVSVGFCHPDVGQEAPSVT